jgi:hypothetical protein
MSYNLSRVPWSWADMPKAEVQTRFKVVEMGFEHDRTVWRTAEPGVTYATLAEADAAGGVLADATPMVRFEIMQRIGVGDYTWVPGHEPEDI